MSETQELAVELQHSALDAFLDRGEISIRDLPNKGRLARLAEHGRGTEDLLACGRQPAETGEHGIADGDGDIALSAGDYLRHEKRIARRCAMQGDSVQIPAVYEGLDSINR